jgi:hypothetical protein
MNTTLLRSLLALIPVVLLISGAALLFLRDKRTYSLLQFFGAGCLLLVVLTHICEALRLFPGMHWGEDNSVGHYINLGSAISHTVSCRISATRVQEMGRLIPRE